MEYHYDRRGIAPWIWVLIVLGALILVFVVWWAVAASGPETTVVVPPEEQPTTPPTTQPSQPSEQPSEQPTSGDNERPVNIYIERDQPSRVIVVPRGERLPEAEERLRQVDLPGQFRYQGKTWRPSDEAVTGDAANVKDTGANIDGNIVYADQDAEPPYDRLYIETSPGSGIYVRYEPAS